MNEKFDGLDRALFALPLAVPPSDLRAAILRATVDAPTSATEGILLFSRAEITGIGCALALATWLIIAAIADHRFAVAMTTNAFEMVRSLVEPTTLAWITTGGAISALLTLGNLRPQRRGIRKS